MPSALVSALTLDWLEQQGYERLARDAVVAINAVRPNGLVELDPLQQYLFQVVIQVGEASAQVAQAVGHVQRRLELGHRASGLSAK